MKKFTALFVALAVLSFGALAFGHGGGGGQGYGGGCGGPGYGGGSGSGSGYGGGGPGFMGRLAGTEEGRKFLEDTKELRKKIHDLKYEIKEAWIADDEKKAEKLEAELGKLRDELWEKADKAGIEKKRGYGKRGKGRGYGGGPDNCAGPGGYGY